VGERVSGYRFAEDIWSAEFCGGVETFEEEGVVF